MSQHSPRLALTVAAAHRNHDRQAVFITGLLPRYFGWVQQFGLRVHSRSLGGRGRAKVGKAAVSCGAAAAACVGTSWSPAVLHELDVAIFVTEFLALVIEWLANHE